MDITEARIKLVENSTERLRAFCSITLDGNFVIRDLKIIEGLNGLFVAMPSRKLADRCTRCGCKNHLRAKFCNDCGQRLNENRAPKDAHGRAKLHADVAHPINAGCRQKIQNAVVEAYHEEVEKSKHPDYKPPKFDDFDDFMDDDHFEHGIEPASATPAAAAPPRETPRVAAEVTDNSEPAEGEDAFSDYNSLIAELKRDAQGRRRPGEAEPEPEPQPASVAQQSEDIDEDELQPDLPSFRAQRGEQPQRGERRDRRDGHDRGQRGGRPHDRRDGGRGEGGRRDGGNRFGGQGPRGPRPEGHRRHDRGEEQPSAPPPGRPAQPAPQPPPPPPPQPRNDEDDDFGAGLF